MWYLPPEEKNVSVRYPRRVRVGSAYQLSM